MTQEDKELLLKDLSARLTYGVKIKYATSPINHCIFTLTELNVKTSYNERLDLHYYPKLNGVYYYFDCQPYLRPMSSMTEEEVKEFNNLPSTKNYKIVDGDLPWDVANYKQLDWLLKNHFDFRGLIPKGLAIEVTEENNPYKE